MRKILILFLLFTALVFTGCTHQQNTADIAATTLPVYEFTSVLCQNTGLSVARLITESVSCLHDYSLQVNQMRMIESADTVVISGAGLEDFLDDALSDANAVIDASIGVHVHHGEHHDDHGHQNDAHIWLSPENAKIMAKNICDGLTLQYPQYKDIFAENLISLLSELDDLQNYGTEKLSVLSCRSLITFHDGFAYLAESFDLTILRAVEEESGSEASAKELKELIILARQHQLPAIFTERSGSVSAADVISAETGIEVYTLDMAMAGDSYFNAMYYNIDTIKEALG